MFAYKHPQTDLSCLQILRISNKKNPTPQHDPIYHQANPRGLDESLVQ